MAKKVVEGKMNEKEVALAKQLLEIIKELGIGEDAGDGGLIMTQGTPVFIAVDSVALLAKASVESLTSNPLGESLAEMMVAKEMCNIMGKDFNEEMNNLQKQQKQQGGVICAICSKLLTEHEIVNHKCNCGSSEFTRNSK